MSRSRGNTIAAMSRSRGNNIAAMSCSRGNTIAATSRSRGTVANTNQHRSKRRWSWVGGPLWAAHTVGTRKLHGAMRDASVAVCDWGGGARERCFRPPDFGEPRRNRDATARNKITTQATTSQQAPHEHPVLRSAPPRTECGALADDGRPGSVGPSGRRRGAAPGRPRPREGLSLIHI